jgi:hypothetical protein
MPEAKTEAEKRNAKRQIEIPPGRYGATDGCPCIDLYALADELYKLMKADLRLERERLGRR